MPANFAIASPPEFARDLVADSGPFETLGWPELTNPVKDGLLGDEFFLEHMKRANRLGHFRQSAHFPLNGNKLLRVGGNLGIVKLRLEFFVALQLRCKAGKHDGISSAAVGRNL